MTDTAIITERTPVATKIPSVRRTLLILQRDAYKNLECTAKILYLWVTELSDGRSKFKYPGTSQMATLLNVARQTLWRAERSLEENKLAQFLTEETAQGQIAYVEILNVEEPSQDELLNNFRMNTMVEMNIQTYPKGKRKAKAKPQLKTSDFEVSDPTIVPSEDEKTTSGKLTDAEKEKIVSSYENMTNYLLYGASYFRTEDKASLKPAITNWRVHGGTTGDPKAEDWTGTQFAGYYWFRVSGWRAEHGVPLSFYNPGWLGRDIKQLRESMTARQLFFYIACVMKHFDLIRYMLGSAGRTLTPHENTLTHKLVRSSADAISQLGEHALAEMYDRMNSGKPLPAWYTQQAQINS